jgi:hypothetical protein
MLFSGNISLKQNSVIKFPFPIAIKLRKCSLRDRRGVQEIQKENDS